MKEFTFTVTDPLGIHARPAGQLAKEAKKVASKVMIEKDGKAVDMSKLIALMGLAVKQNEVVKVTVEGEDEETAAAAIEEFMKANF